MHSNLFSKLPSVSLDILSEDHLVFRSVTVKVWYPRKYSIDRPGAFVLCCQGGRDYTDFAGYLGNCETLNTCLCGVLNTNTGQILFSSVLLTVWPALSRWTFANLLFQCNACKSSLWIMTVATDISQQNGHISESISHLGIIWKPIFDFCWSLDEVPSSLETVIGIRFVGEWRYYAHNGLFSGCSTSCVGSLARLFVHPGLPSEWKTYTPWQGRLVANILSENVILTSELAAGSSVTTSGSEDDSEAEHYHFSLNKPLISPDPVSDVWVVRCGEYRLWGGGGGGGGEKDDDVESCWAEANSHPDGITGGLRVGRVWKPRCILGARRASEPSLSIHGGAFPWVRWWWWWGGSFFRPLKGGSALCWVTAAQMCSIFECDIILFCFFVGVASRVHFSTV